MRVLVTRPAGQEAELVSRLSAVGFDVVHAPLIAIESVGDDPIDVNGYDWVVVTSPNGARELTRRARGRLPRVAAIGEATAAVLGGADLIPRVSTQEGLLAEFPRPAGRVLFVAAEGARRVLADELAADVVVAYRTVERPPTRLPAADLATVASPSAARSLSMVPRRGSPIPVVSIGPETTRAAVAVGLTVVAEAVSHDVAGLVAAVQRVAVAR